MYPVGCTFLDWSLMWLSGQKEFFNAEENKWLSLVSDPLTVANAHKHQKNHPEGFIETKQFVEKLKSASNNQFLFSFYPTCSSWQMLLSRSGMCVTDLQDSEKWSKLLEIQKNEYVEMLGWIVQEQNLPLVFVHLDPLVRGYLWQPRNLNRFSFSAKTPGSFDELVSEKQQIFFPKTEQAWHDIGLTEIWDQRERMALDLRPFDPSMHDDITLPFSHVWINCQDLWFDTVNVVLDLALELKIKVNQERLEAWLPIVSNWQSIQNKQLKFWRMLPQIVNATVRGHYHPIPDLTLEQESIIQHMLIYDHNLNLKTWQLSKFPNNTIALHGLLEPNFHPLTKEHGA